MVELRTSQGTTGVSATSAAPGIPILFLHGVGSTKEVWQPQLDHFNGRRTAIAIDHPGYGESDFRAAATHDDFAWAALTALDALGHSQVHVCGLSLGGVVAIAMHALAPERCASLILADSFAVHPDGAGILERSVAGSASMADFARARAALLLAGCVSPALHEAVIATMSQIDPAAYRIAARAVWLADQRERVREIRVPTLILCGEEDRATPPELSRELHMMIPHSALTIIANSGHLTNIEQPGSFNRLVDGFLDDVDRPAG